MSETQISKIFRGACPRTSLDGHALRRVCTPPMFASCACHCLIQPNPELNNLETGYSQVLHEQVPMNLKKAIYPLQLNYFFFRIDLNCTRASTIASWVKLKGEGGDSCPALEITGVNDPPTFTIWPPKITYGRSTWPLKF